MLSETECLTGQIMHDLQFSAADPSHDMTIGDIVNIAESDLNFDLLNKFEVITNLIKILELLIVNITRKMLIYCSWILENHHFK